MLWPKERVNTLVMLRCCASYVETFLTDTMHETLAGVCDVKIEMASQQRTPRSSSDASDLISMT